MRRLVHLSDLHFGRDRPELLDPLIEAINDLSPDLVAISGDLTQRARPAQFQEAKDFIARLTPPVMVVPGNHDVPLHNLFMRLFMPWRNYRKWISKELEPFVEDDEMIVVGVNTVDPLSWQRGWFSRRAIARVCGAFQETRGRRARLVVAHHPMEHLPGQKKKLMRGAERAIDELSECNADIILSGHLHTWRATTFAERTGRNAILQIHAGTGLSTRVRGEPNDFNLIGIEGNKVSVHRYAVEGEDTTFAPTEMREFVLHPGGWAAQQGYETPA